MLRHTQHERLCFCEERSAHTERVYPELVEGKYEAGNRCFQNRIRYSTIHEQGWNYAQHFLALMAVACIAATGAFAELKIGYIDSKAILAKYQGLTEAQGKLDKEVAKWDQNLSKRYKDIKDLKELIEKQSLILSDERKKALQDSLDQMVAQARQEERKIYGPKVMSTPKMKS